MKPKFSSHLTDAAFIRAQQMVQNFYWGTFSTISTMPGFEGAPFANPISFAQVNNTPYVYVSSLDQSIQDLLVDPRVSLGLSSAEKLSSPTCGTVPGVGDAESPLCSRLTSKCIKKEWQCGV